MESIRLYQVDNGKLSDITKEPSEDEVMENIEVHDWICKNPEVIETGLTIIGRKVACGSKQIDVLAIDSKKRVVIIEAKRTSAARDVVAQVIDYASRLDEWELSQYRDQYHAYCASLGVPGTLTDDLFDQLSDEFRILIVCFGVDPDVKRMVEWLAEYCDLNISLSVFSFGVLNGQRLLATIVVQENTRHRKTRSYDEELRSLIREIDSQSNESNGIIQSYAGRGVVYERTITATASGVSAQLMFDNRIPVLLFDGGVAFGTGTGLSPEPLMGKTGFRFKEWKPESSREIAAEIINALKKAQKAEAQ